MRVSFCSAKERQQLTPSETTTLIELSDQVDSVKVVEGKWHKHAVVPCKFHEGNREFNEIDAQAAAIGHFLKDALSIDRDVIVSCDHGELRSPAVGMGISVAIGDCGLWKIENATHEEVSGSLAFGTFGGRTMGIIADILENRVR